jgi:hypothetical protein
MQTCSLCNSSSPDEALLCTHCNAELREFSVTAITRKKYGENPRVDSVRVVVYDNCCPACRQAQGDYPKYAIPRLPVEGCSSPNGCRCFYQPFLNDL